MNLRDGDVEVARQSGSTQRVITTLGHPVENGAPVQDELNINVDLYSVDVAKDGIRKLNIIDLGNYRVPFKQGAK